MSNNKLRHGYSVGKEKIVFDNSVIKDKKTTEDLLFNILESSTEFSIIAEDLNGLILLWNEGAGLLYGYDSQEVVDKMNGSDLHTPEDIKKELPQLIMQATLKNGKYDNTIIRRRKDGSQFSAHVVATVRHNADVKPVGILVLSQNVTTAFETSQYARGLVEASLDSLMS